MEVMHCHPSKACSLIRSLIRLCYHLSQLIEYCVISLHILQLQLNVIFTDDVERKGEIYASTPIEIKFITNDIIIIIITSIKIFCLISFPSHMQYTLSLSFSLFILIYLTTTSHISFLSFYYFIPILFTILS